MQNKRASELNENYFKSLIATRASMGTFVLAPAGIAVAGIDYTLHSLTAVYYRIVAPYDIISVVLIFSAVIMLISLLVGFDSPVRRLFYNHQRFSSIWQLIFVFLFYLVLTVLTAILMLAEDSMLNIYGSPYSLPFLIGGGLFYLLCILYNVRWLRTELSKGMSEERRQKNYLAKSAVTSPTSLLLIFGVTMIAPLLFKGTLMTGLGLTMFIILTGAFSRLHVEYAYVAVLKWQDKEYWEEYRREDGLTIPRNKLLFVIRLIIELVVFFGIIYFGLELIDQGSSLIFPLRLVAVGIVIYWCCRIGMWLYKNKS